VEIDPEQKIDEKTFVALNPTGGCMIGSTGQLYSVHDLKLELLKCKPEKLTLTLDCCRNKAFMFRGDLPCVRLRYDIRTIVLLLTLFYQGQDTYQHTGPGEDCSDIWNI
jgi:hypothetical protein